MELEKEELEHAKKFYDGSGLKSQLDACISANDDIVNFFMRDKTACNLIKYAKLYKQTTYKSLDGVNVLEEPECPDFINLYSKSDMKANQDWREWNQAKSYTAEQLELNRVKAENLKLLGALRTVYDAWNFDIDIDEDMQDEIRPLLTSLENKEETS